VKGQKIDRHIIFESVQMLFAKNCGNSSVVLETTAYQTWHVFRQCIRIIKGHPANTASPGKTVVKRCMCISETTQQKLYIINYYA